MSTFKALKSYAKGCAGYYIAIVATVLLSSVFDYTAPLITGFVIDSVIGTEPVSLSSFVPQAVTVWINGMGRQWFIDHLWYCGAAYVFIMILACINMFYRAKSTACASERISENVRNNLFESIMHADYEYHNGINSGDIIQRCTSDVETVRRFMAGQITEIIRAVVSITIAAVFMFDLNVKLTLIVLTIVPVLFVFNYIYFKKVRKLFKEVDESEGKLSDTLKENVAGVRVVRAFARQSYENEKFDKKNRAYKDLLFNLNDKMSFFWALSDFLSYFATGLIFTVGAAMVLNHTMSLGVLVIFTTYSGKMLWPVKELGRILSDFGKMTVAIGRIEEVLAVPGENMTENGEKPEISSDIVFDNVSFGYGSGRKVLDGLSFTAEKGKTIAILGSTGSGKSTIMHLLMRLYDYDGGSIRIGGVELKAIDKKYLRSRIGIVLQEPFLFSKNIRENIALPLNSEENKTERIENAARIACVHDVINSFEKGYDTMVGEKGVTLSGGQKQRVAMARTIIRDCDVLIFDDSLSAVDTETDRKIRRALAQRSKDTTTFIISHRITTLAEADKIIVIDKGRVVDEGVHSELITREGIYKRIWDIQSNLQDEEQETPTESEVNELV